MPADCSRVASARRALSMLCPESKPVANGAILPGIVDRSAALLASTESSAFDRIEGDSRVGGVQSKRVKLTARGEQKLRSLSRIHLDELSAAAPALAKILRSFKAKTR
jgi:hypothetical protein